MEILEKLLQFLESIIQMVWSVEPSFYTKVEDMVIIVVFILTYVSITTIFGGKLLFGIKKRKLSFRDRGYYSRVQNQSCPAQQRAESL